MVYRVSRLQTLKSKGNKESEAHALTEIARVTADRFEITERDGRAFNLEHGICFYVDEPAFLWGKGASRLVAFFPATDWIVEEV